MSMHQRKNAPQYSEWRRSNGDVPKELVLCIVISCSGIKENVFFFFPLSSCSSNQCWKIKITVSGAFLSFFFCEQYLICDTNQCKSGRRVWECWTVLPILCSVAQYYFFSSCYTCRHWDDSAGIKDLISGKNRKKSIPRSCFWWCGSQCWDLLSLPVWVRLNEFRVTSAKQWHPL